MSDHPGGRNAANSSVIRRRESVNRYSAGGRPPLLPEGAVVPVRVRTCRRASTVGGWSHRLVPERGAIDVAQRRHREFGRGEPVGDVGVRKFGGETGVRVGDHHPVIERHLRQVGHRVPCRVLGQLRIGGDRHQAEVGRRDGAGVGYRSGAENTESCSRCATSRTSTFSASCRLADDVRSSSSRSRPPGSDQVPDCGSSARCHSRTPSSGPDRGVSEAAGKWRTWNTTMSTS